MFDAFDTLVHIERDRLPASRIGGSIRRTTVPAVHRIYEEAAGRISIDRFFEAFQDSSVEANRRRRRDLREIPSPDRFRIMIELLNRDAAALPGDLPERLAETHMAHLAPAMTIRGRDQEVLEWSRERSYRLALVSNFDHSRALEACLERHGVRHLFEAVVVSDAVGWRKPHPRIFEHALRAMDIVPADALFVGDRLELDVDGAAGSGIDAVWVDHGRESWTPDHAVPKHTIRRLEELVEILEGR
jgi:FMN phosphatase YigB (HAD superfamily)